MRNETIGVIGAGLMGHAIAQAFSTAGYRVLLNDVSQEKLSAAMENIQTDLRMLASLGLMDETAVQHSINGIETVSNLEYTAAQSDIVIEAVSENLDVKKIVFEELDRTSPKQTILTSNTSSFLPDTLASITKRPGKVLVTHFFNPPFLIPLVEVVRGTVTSEGTVTTVMKLLTAAGKKPVVIRKALPGFLINRLQIAILREALSLVEKGVVTVQDVDIAVRNSIGRRLSVAGIFEVCDITGLDVVQATATNILNSLDSTTELSDLIKEKISAGELGFKTEKGFYSWTEESELQLKSRIARALAAIASWNAG